MTTIDVRPDTFEEVMMEVAAATDANGRRIKLYTGQPTAEGLREASRDFMDNFAPGNVWLNGFDAPTQGNMRAAEAKGYENLALLARATAAAIREGK